MNKHEWVNKCMRQRMCACARVRGLSLQSLDGLRFRVCMGVEVGVDVVGVVYHKCRLSIMNFMARSFMKFREISVANQQE